ncbi:MAG TPA: RHS repeat-associated core domain-containing protein, partial [Rhizomicrobium sp.]
MTGSYRITVAALVLLTALASLPRAAAAAQQFVAARNPFAYAGEYRDPIWGGPYLRARWYQPTLPSFVSSDPLSAKVNHYGYRGGNPVMRV